MVTTSADNFRREVSRDEQRAEFLSTKIEKHFYDCGELSEDRLISVGLEIFRESFLKMDLSVPPGVLGVSNPQGRITLEAIKAQINEFTQDYSEQNLLYGSVLEIVTRFTVILYQADYQRKHRMEPA